MSKPTSNCKQFSVLTIPPVTVTAGGHEHIKVPGEKVRRSFGGMLGQTTALLEEKITSKETEPIQHKEESIKRIEGADKVTE